MRVLGGKLKGRNIVVPQGIRPVSIRIRKSCFDILQPELGGKKVLDLFAGSGSLGIEAYSRGAKECVFIDSERAAIKALKRNIASFDIGSQTRLYRKDAYMAIRDFFASKEGFDTIFLDPPYYKQMLIKALQQLDEYDIVRPSGYIVALCYKKDAFITESNNFSLIIDRKYGQTLLLIYRRN